MDWTYGYCFKPSVPHNLREDTGLTFPMLVTAISKLQQAITKQEQFVNLAEILHRMDEARGFFLQKKDEYKTLRFKVTKNRKLKNDPAQQIRQDIYVGPKFLYENFTLISFAILLCVPDSCCLK